MNFGSRLFKLRKKSGLSQEELSNKLDISRQSVSKWENNTVLPDTEKLIKLAEIFNVSIDYLLIDSNYDDNRKDVFSNCNGAVAGLQKKDDEILKKMAFKFIAYFLIFMSYTLILIWFDYPNWLTIVPILISNSLGALLYFFIQKYENEVSHSYQVDVVIMGLWFLPLLSLLVNSLSKTIQPFPKFGDPISLALFVIIYVPALRLMYKKWIKFK